MCHQQSDVSPHNEICIKLFSLTWYKVSAFLSNYVYPMTNLKYFLNVETLFCKRLCLCVAVINIISAIGGGNIFLSWIIDIFFEFVNYKKKAKQQKPSFIKRIKFAATIQLTKIILFIVIFPFFIHLLL